MGRASQFKLHIALWFPVSTDLAGSCPKTAHWFEKQAWKLARSAWS